MVNPVTQSTESLVHLFGDCFLPSSIRQESYSYQSDGACSIRREYTTPGAVIGGFGI